MLSIVITRITTKSIKTLARRYTHGRQSNGNFATLLIQRRDNFSIFRANFFPEVRRR